MRADGADTNVLVAVPYRATDRQVDRLELDRELETVERRHLPDVHLRGSERARDTCLARDRVEPGQLSLEVGRQRAPQPGGEPDLSRLLARRLRELRPVGKNEVTDRFAGEHVLARGRDEIVERRPEERGQVVDQRHPRGAHRIPGGAAWIRLATIPRLREPAGCSCV